MARSFRWWLVVVLVPGGFIVLVAALTLLTAGRMPDPLAVHWGLDGRPNGTMPATLSHLFLIGGMVVAWSILVVTSRAGKVPSPVAAFVFYLVALLGAVQIQIVAANLDAVSWETADELSAALVGVVVFAAIASGVLGWVLAGGKAAMPKEPPLEGELPIADVGEAVAWEGSSSNGWLIVVAFGLAGIGVLIPLPWSLLLVAIALLVAHFTVASMAVDAGSVSVGIGYVRFPKRRYSIDGFARAEVFSLHPMNYGGWGYRIGNGARAIVIRSGPAIRLVREHQHDVVITVDDAVTGAGLINGVLAGRGLLRLPE